MSLLPFIPAKAINWGTYMHRPESLPTPSHTTPSMHSSQHNIMMSSNNTKKRRVGAGGGDAPPSLPADGENNNGSVHDELKMISSHMTNMLQMMSSMQGEIIRLTEKCDRMEKSIDTMQRTQIANYNTTNQIKRTIKSMQTAQNTNSQNTNPDLTTWITNKSITRY